MIKFATFLICFCAIFAAPPLRDGQIRDAKSALTQFCEHFGSAPDAEKIRRCTSFFEVSEGEREWYVQPKRENLRKDSAGFYLGYPVFSVSKTTGAIDVSSEVN